MMQLNSKKMRMEAGLLKTYVNSVRWANRYVFGSSRLC